MAEHMTYKMISQILLHATMYRPLMFLGSRATFYYFKSHHSPGLIRKCLCCITFAFLHYCNKIFTYILRFSLFMNYFIPVFYCTCKYFGDLSQCLELQKSIYTQNFFAVYLFSYTIIYGGI